MTKWKRRASIYTYQHSIKQGPFTFDIHYISEESEGPCRLSGYRKVLNYPLLYQYTIQTTICREQCCAQNHDGITEITTPKVFKERLPSYIEKGTQYREPKIFKMLKTRNNLI